MDTTPILWVSFVILLAAATIWIVQVVRGRKGSGDGRGPWWEGPWDDDR